MVTKRTVLYFVVAYVAYRYATQPNTKLSSPLVNTESGKVQGIVSLSRNGREFYEYLGIPYAKAERFESPQPPDSWEGVRSANDYGAKCTHMDMLVGGIHGEEDCLFLNVYIPKERKNNQFFPIMIYIHGGHFTESSSNNHRPDYLMDEDVIVVTMNYRLGALGFLSTGDGVVRGNNGLKDQVQALRWVQQNIANFHGDPNRVTIFGESAGSACVHYHILSPMSKGLFHKAISESGVAVSPWTFMPNPKKQAMRLGEKLGCPTGTTEELVKCLKAKPAYDIAVSHRDILDPIRDPMSVYVVTAEKIIDDDTFLSVRPETILKNGDFHDIPYLLGVNADEGLISSALIMRDENLLKELEDNWVEHSAKIFYSEPDASISQKVRDFYFGKGERLDNMDKFENHTSIISDRHFFTGFDMAIRHHSKKSPTYVYYYSYEGEFTLTNILLAIKGRLPVLVEVISYLAITWVKSTFLGIKPPKYGVCHADELVLIISMPGLIHIGKDHQDYQMSVDLVKLWTDFAKDEKVLKFKGQKWEPWSEKNSKYLQLDSTTGLIDPPFLHRLKFWEGLNFKDRL